MIEVSSQNISMLIGKPVTDDLNHEIGEVLSFIIDSTGHVSEVLVKGNNGEHLCYPVDRLSMDGDFVRLLSEIDNKVKMTSENIPLLWRKKKILDKLLNENKILPEIYEKLYAEFDEALTSLKADAQTIMDDLDKQIKDYEKLFKTLHFGKTYLDIEREIDHVDEETYRQSMNAILNGLTDVVEKKQDLQEKRETLSNILLGEERISESVQEETEEPQVQEVHEEIAVEGQEQKEETTETTVSEPVITVHMR